MTAFHKRHRLGKQVNKEYTEVSVYKIRYLIDWESPVESCMQQSLMVRVSFWSLDAFGSFREL